MKNKPTKEEIKKIQELFAGYDYEEEVATFNRADKKWYKETVIRHRTPDPWEVYKWLSLHPTEIKKWYQFWK